MILIIVNTTGWKLISSFEVPLEYVQVTKFPLYLRMREEGDDAHQPPFEAQVVSSPQIKRL